MVRIDNLSLDGGSIKYIRYVNNKKKGGEGLGGWKKGKGPQMAGDTRAVPCFSSHSIGYRAQAHPSAISAVQLHHAPRGAAPRDREGPHLSVVYGSSLYCVFDFPTALRSLNSVRQATTYNAPYSTSTGVAG